MSSTLAIGLSRVSLSQVVPSTFVAATKLDGSTWLKLTLLNPMAEAGDITGILAEIRAIGAELQRVPEVA